jgi:hypothetical protein
MEMFFNKLPRGQGEKIRWSSSNDRQTMCACAHSICLPSFLPTDFKEQAGRTQGLHNRVRAPSPTPPPAHSLCDNCRLVVTSPKTLQNPGTLKGMARTPAALQRWTTSNVLLLFGRGILWCKYEFCKELRYIYFQNTSLSI